MKKPLMIFLLFILALAVHAQEQGSARLRGYLPGPKHWSQYFKIKDPLLENIILSGGENISPIITMFTIATALLLTAFLWQYREKLLADRSLLRQEKMIVHQNHNLAAQSLRNDEILAQKELLIKGMHQQELSNLLVMISLLDTSSANLNEPQTAVTIRQNQERMQSISLIYQRLYQSGSHAVINVSAYVPELIHFLRQRFNTGKRIAFHLDIAEIELDLQRAVPLGLILNETVTNALTHAFKSEKRGDISIQLVCTGRQLSLTISDNGCGTPKGVDLNQCESPGIKLIKNMCREIGAILVFEQDFGITIMIDTLLSSNDISPFDDGLK